MNYTPRVGDGNPREPAPQPRQQPPILPIIVASLVALLVAGIPAITIALRAPTDEEIDKKFQTYQYPYLADKEFIRNAIADLRTHKGEDDARYDAVVDTLTRILERLARIEAELGILQSQESPRGGPP